MIVTQKMFKTENDKLRLDSGDLVYTPTYEDIFFQVSEEVDLRIQNGYFAININTHSEITDQFIILFDTQKNDKT